jgi:hypothetical protein
VEKLHILYTFLHNYDFGPPFAFNTVASLHCTESDVITVVNMKSVYLWLVAACRSEKARRFAGTNPGSKNKQTRKRQNQTAS